MATAETVNSSGGVQVLQQLAQLLGGTKTTQSTSADTAALQTLLTQLQGQDYTALLQSIFQQAGSAIPGLSSARANATGARTTNNSALATDLDKLLQATVLKAQQQIATQQQQNNQLQAQVASGIAQGNQKTTQQSGANLGGAAKNLALLQLLNKGANTFGIDLKKQAKNLFGVGEGSGDSGGGISFGNISFDGNAPISMDYSSGLGTPSNMDFNGFDVTVPDISHLFDPSFGVNDLFGSVSGTPDLSGSLDLGLDFSNLGMDSLDLSKLSEISF